ncbi:MAG: hypothetical protein KUG82_00395 [Pseudomonadales bacterium]|nr:hypothetical protein [Pseudomonadales bacterium]
MANKKVCVDIEFARAILGAGASTALNHRGEKDEMYALGALEATANLLNVMAVDSGNVALEALCHKLAGDAVDRYGELCEEHNIVSRLGRRYSVE